MTICREWLLVKTIGSVATAEPLRCRSWACEFCAPDRRKQLIAQAIGGLPNTFITLTITPNVGQSPDHRARMLVAAWRTIRRWATSEHAQIDPLELENWRNHQLWRSNPSRPRDILGREHPDNGTVPFMAVFERTKKGEPHLHILARAEWVPQGWLSKCCASLLCSPVVDVRRITNRAKMAAYVAKYCGKDPASFGTVKRYWCSQDYEIDKPLDHEDRQLDGATFEIFRSDAQDWVTQKEREGWIVQWIDDRLTAFDMRKPPPAAASPPFQERAPPAAARAAQPCQASAPSTSLMGAILT
jgi:hypothetical protein